MLISTGPDVQFGEMLEQSSAQPLVMRPVIPHVSPAVSGYKEPLAKGCFRHPEILDSRLPGAHACSTSVGYAAEFNFAPTCLSRALSRFGRAAQRADCRAIEAWRCIGSDRVIIRRP